MAVKLAAYILFLAGALALLWLFNTIVEALWFTREVPE